MWLSCFRCWIMKICAWCILLIICNVGHAFDMSNLVTRGHMLCITCILLFHTVLYLWNCLTWLLAYFVIPLSVWQVHLHLCNDDQDEIQYYATVLYSRATIIYCASWFETSCCLCITILYQANRVPSTDVWWMLTWLHVV